MLDDVDSRNWQRPLSSYEILMSRTAPGSSRLALSHAAVFHLNRQVEEEQLVQALEYTIAR